MTDEYQKILQPYRDKIDDLDNQITNLLTTREEIIRSVATLKKEQGIPAILPARIDEVIARCTDQAKSSGKDGYYVQAIYKEIVAQSCALETQIMNMKQDSENE